MHPEERFNALAGLSLDLSPYRPWCGGCTAEALAAAPLYRLLGPMVLTWKVVPAALHMATAAGGAAYAWKRSPWASVVWLLLLLAAPPALRELSVTGWGNHVDSLAFPLVAAALIRWDRPYAAGLVAGLGWWFCTTTFLAVPGLLLLDRRWLVTAPVGALPMLFNGWAPPSSPLALADIGAWMQWLGGSFATSGWWFEGPHLAASAWGLGLLALALASRDRLALATVLAFAAMSLSHPGLWEENREDWALRAFELRYRAVPLAFLLLGASLSRYRGLALLVLPLGLGMRMQSWGAPTAALGLRIDAEVPEFSACEQQGFGFVEGITGWGTRPPDEIPYAPACDGYEAGAAWGWALHVGCDGSFPGSGVAMEQACESLRGRDL